MKKSILALMTLVVAAPALAEVKAPGTVLELTCGNTQTFPGATEVCVNTVEGRTTKYLSISHFNSEAVLNPGDEMPTRARTYFLVKSTKTKGTKTTYTAVGVEPATVGEGAPMEATWTLTVDYQKNTGTLKRNGQGIFGGEGIQMETIFHTQGF